MQRATFGTVLALFVAAMTGVTRADPAAAPIALHGPAIGNNRYQSKIESVDGTPDVDDFVGDMLPGEALTASVVAAKKSTLRPRLELIGPDGVAVNVAVKVPKAGTSAQFKSFVIPATGAWTVRVSGAGGTQGDYVITFSVKKTRPQTVHGRQLGDDQPTFKVEKFRGVDGGLFDLKLTWTKTSNPVELRSLTDPHGGDVLAPDGKPAVEHASTDLRRRTVSLTGMPLHVGDGEYALRVRTVQGTSTYDAVFVVTPRSRAQGRRPIVLSGVEPVLATVAAPLRGRAGFVLNVQGEHFSVAPRPRVWFGDYEGAVLDVAPDGKSISVRVPQGVPGTAVSVTVANGDGQATGRANYFFYLQPIVVTDVVDDDRAPVRNASAEGGKLVHVLGAFFEAGQKVSMGGADARVVGVQSAGEMLVVTPTAPPGDSHVVVTDVYGGVASSAFTIHFKAPPTFDPHPYDPPVAKVNSPAFVTVKGKNFLEDDQLSFAGAPVNSTFVDGQTRTFNVPALTEGSYSVTLTDDIGTVKRGPDFFVAPPPTITAVTIVAGPHIGTTKIPVSGGATIQVDGAHFHDTDVVTLGGAAVTFDSHTATRFTFTAPAGAPGDATLSVVDGAGQSATVANALRYVGYTDATAARSPGASATDSLTADRGAVGDLDGDGKVDDLVVVSSYYTYVGTRTELTRLYFGDATGKLVDVTATKFPAAGTDSSGADDWNATAVAVGDVDGAHGVDVVIAGVSPYGPYYGVYKSVRMFLNDGSGGFTQDEVDAPPSAYVAGVRAVDQTGAYFLVYSTVFETGYPTSVAIGDLDHDGKPEIVVGRDHYDFRYVGIDPTQVDFTQTPPYVQSANVNYLSVFQYNSATKIYKNDIAGGNGFVDRTAAWMPSAGDSVTPPTACFQSLDLALGDVDGDGNVDIVETWDDPTTVSAFGTYVGTNVDSPRIATRVLRNNGTGVLTDVTASWMPAGSQNEFWQANRLALVDLNKDGKPDLVLLHAAGTDAFNTSPPSFGSTALRVLRNTGTAFVDVTATAIPALPGNGDNFRGGALAVRDVDGDGWVDILIGTMEPMTDAAGNPLPRTRLLRGGPGLVFTLDTAFLPTVDKDSGEATDIVLVGDLAGRPDPSLVLLSNTAPLNSAAGELLRILDWNR
jgi:hypothetical protein